MQTEYFMNKILKAYRYAKTFVTDASEEHISLCLLHAGCLLGLFVDLWLIRRSVAYSSI
jgi:hypothetical protein